MQSGRSADDPLVSRAEIARLAGVQRPAVTNWEKRHQDFPEPISSGAKEYFHLARILAWLESRTIPANARLATEPEGATYADRVRRNRSIDFPQSSVVLASEVGPSDGTTIQQLLGELTGPLADSVRGSGSVADYLHLLFSLVLLRVCESRRYSALAREAQAIVGREDATSLLRRVGDSADEVLRRRGLLPGMRASLLRLQPRAYPDLVTVIDLSGGLGRSAFRLLLDRYETQVGLKSDEFFTPPSLARLIARILVHRKSTVKRIYDPYARGGELLAAVADMVAKDLSPGVDPPVLRGESPYRDSLRLAGINLALYGFPVEIEISSSVPWNEAGWPESKSAQRKADLIVTNPPFNRGTPRIRKDHEWTYGPPPPGNDNFAWLQHVLASLDVNGRAAVVMPNNAGVSTNKKEHDIRSEMVELGAVECVITLPSQLFPGTQIPVSLWILKHPGGHCGKILFIEAGGMGVKRGAGVNPRHRRTLEDKDLNYIKDVYWSWRENCESGRDHPRDGFSISVDVHRIRRHGHSLNSAEYLAGEGVARAAQMTTSTDVLIELIEMRDEQRNLCTMARDVDMEVDGLFFVSVLPAQDNLPDGWRREPLHELCEIQAGPSYSRLPAKERSKGGEVPVVLPKHINNNRIMNIDHDRVSQRIAGNLRDFWLETGDILCVRSGTMGRSARVEEYQNGWLSSTNLLRIHRFKSAEIDSFYLLYYLSLPHVVAWIKTRSRTTTAIPSISSEALGQLSIVLPPLAEQRRIVEALKALDEQITAHSDLVQVSKKIRAGLAEHLMEGILAVE